MSVAFRREEDDAHREPEFELPLPPGPNWVTPAGLAQIAAKDAALKDAIAAEPDEAARKKLAREHRYWATRHATARLAEPPEPGVAGIGSTVTVDRSGRAQTFTIVGHDEADPAAGKLAFTAPLARAAMGAMAGERVAFGGVAEALEILAVA